MVLRPNEGLITLGTGHSLMMGHKPVKLPDNELAERFLKNSKIIDTVGQFGFWGGDIDYNTFYPGIGKEDFVPQDDDFINPVFRLLSACIVSKYYPTDFSIGDVLKNSIPLIVGQTVNCDHETNIGNAIGAVASAVWQESYTDEKTGLFIPAGINGTLKIDAKSNPRLTRGILMEPPSVHSNSVTVRFTWERSHPEMEDREFWDKIGTFDKDGNLIKRNVTEIIGYYETSLVSHGADPYARKIDDKTGGIIDPVGSSRAYSYNDSIKSNSFYFQDFKKLGIPEDKHEKVGVDSLNNTFIYYHEKDFETESNSKNPIIKDNMELEQFLQLIFGNPEDNTQGILNLSEGSTASLQSVVDSVNKLKQENAQLKIDLENAGKGESEQLTQLKEEVRLSKPKVELADTVLDGLRTEATDNYNKLFDSPDETILNLLKTSDYKTVSSLNNSYKAKLEEKFPMSCKECGSHDVSRASASSFNEDNAPRVGVPSTEDVMNNIRRDAYYKRK